MGGGYPGGTYFGQYAPGGTVPTPQPETVEEDQGPNRSGALPWRRLEANPRLARIERHGPKHLW